MNKDSLVAFGWIELWATSDKKKATTLEFLAQWEKIRLDYESRITQARQDGADEAFKEAEVVAINNGGVNRNTMNIVRAIRQAAKSINSPKAGE